MKKRRLNFYIIISFLAVLLLGGCQKTFNFDSDNSDIIPDGIKINYESDVEFNINDGSNPFIEEKEDKDEEADDEDSSDNSDSEELQFGDTADSEDDTSADDNDTLNSGGDSSDNTDSDDSQSDEDLGSVSDSDDESELTVSEDGEYTSKEEVALYIHLYNHLPSNYITKNEAKDLGWDSGAGNLNKVAPGKSIGGDKFGNREGLLPKKDKRVYYECDIDYVKGKRNGKRIVFSNDGLIYYTGDHYETFELLYE